MMKSLSITRPRKKNSKGFTLIEMVIAMVVLVIIMVGIQGYAVPLIDLFHYQTFRQGPASEGKLAVMRMAREMNQVKNPTSVTTANNNTFTFVDVNNTTITYDLSGTNLRRNVGNGAKVLAGNVSFLQFGYYTKEGVVIASPAVSPSETDIRRIEVTLTVTANSRSHTFRSQSMPRNILHG